MKFSDIKLTEEDLAEIEAAIVAYSAKVYGGAMDARAKSLLRQKLMQEAKEGIWSNRDYLEADEGEAPKGAQW